MDISKLLKIMSTDINSLSFGEKLIGGLIVTILAVAIVFTVLILISFAIRLMNKFINQIEKRLSVNKEIIDEDNKEDDELIAVVGVAIASYLSTSSSNIIVKSVVKVNEDESSWAKVGRIEQMNNLR